jgi:hypothetical protein
MRVVCTDDDTRSLKLPWMNEAVSFASTGTSQELSDETGERLIEELDAIEPYEDTQ